MAEHQEIMMFFVPGEARDILHMLSDYIMNMEDRIECYGDDADMDVDKANLAVAIRLYDKFENELETLKHGGGGAS